MDLREFFVIVGFFFYDKFYYVFFLIGYRNCVCGNVNIKSVWSFVGKFVIVIDVMNYV